MLIGNLLGDATSISSAPPGVQRLEYIYQRYGGSIRRTGLDKAYITFEQSGKKSEYLNYLFNIVSSREAVQGLPLMSETVKEYTRNDSRYGTKNTSLYFRTDSLEELKPLADLFLDEYQLFIPARQASSGQ